MRLAERARSAGTALLSLHPAAVVGFGIAAQWLVTAVVAATAPHEGFRYGPPEWSDGTSAAAALVLANVVVLGPLALAAAYVFATALGGRALATWTVAVWIAAPLAASALALAPYDPTIEDRVLPLALGLVPHLGFALGASLTVAAAALVHVRPERTRLAVAAAGVAALVAALAALGQPELSRDAFDAHMAGLREYFWSQRLLQWLPLAGVVALARRSAAAAVAVGGWLASVAVLRAAAPAAGVDGGELFRALLPALPAYLLLAGALPLLVPTLFARLREHGAPRPVSLRRRAGASAPRGARPAARG